MKKKFEELERGDKIYYWDHGKLHTQYVHEANVIDQTSTNTDWYGNTSTWVRRIINLKVGPSMSRVSTTYSWFLVPEAGKDLLDTPYTIFIRTRHFSCIEAAKHWLKQNSDRTFAKAHRHKMRYDNMTKYHKRYEKALEDIENG